MNKPAFDQLSDLINVISTILAEGLTNEQRQAIYREAGIPFTESQPRDELGIFLLLKSVYEKSPSHEFLIVIADHILANQNFQRNVETEIARLRYIVKQKEGILRLPGVPPYVFVLMPFQDQFRELYETAIRPPLEELGCAVRYADELLTVDNIIDDIYAQIIRADLIVADTTGRNPNVFYEIGYSHALNKSVILITQDKDRIPFDIQARRHIFYDIRSPNILKGRIKDTARGVLEAQGFF